MQSWFKTETGVAFLKATFQGKFAYLWVAVLSDGTEVKQFPDEAFDKLINDPDVNGESLEPQRVSVDRLDVKKVKELYLFPSAAAKKFVHLEPVRLIINIEAGEKFVSYWLTDWNPDTGVYFTRHVVGISKLVNGKQAKFFAIIGPTGRVTIATDDNQSFDGE